ncbi:hypothetical protein DFH07DRAFT_852693 [Mycena maculata]|uniref:Uncharacterized protein n=1 Tax=Mycena maculata TaxID=230809 RepID=A0AAD7HRD3_9AGAR|nr:hypothetical protein DFH07DRAFT_852693 [Mycena maculata]
MDQCPGIAGVATPQDVDSVTSTLDLPHVCVYTVPIVLFRAAVVTIHCLLGIRRERHVSDLFTSIVCTDLRFQDRLVISSNRMLLYLSDSGFTWTTHRLKSELPLRSAIVPGHSEAFPDKLLVQIINGANIILVQPAFVNSSLNLGALGCGEIREDFTDVSPQASPCACPFLEVRLGLDRAHFTRTSQFEEFRVCGRSHAVGPQFSILPNDSLNCQTFQGRMPC